MNGRGLLLHLDVGETGVESKTDESGRACRGKEEGREEDSLTTFWISLEYHSESDSASESWSEREAKFNGRADELSLWILRGLIDALGGRLNSSSEDEGVTGSPVDCEPGLQDSEEDVEMEGVGDAVPYLATSDKRVGG